MRSSVTRQVTNSRWQRLTMDKPDCFALMLEDESQAECTFSARLANREKMLSFAVQASLGTITLTTSRFRVVP